MDLKKFIERNDYDSVRLYQRLYDTSRKAMKLDEKHLLYYKNRVRRRRDADALTSYLVRVYKKADKIVVFFNYYDTKLPTNVLDDIEKYASVRPFFDDVRYSLKKVRCAKRRSDENSTYCFYAMAIYVKTCDF